MTAGPTCQPIYVVILLPPLLQAPFACGDGGPTVAVRGDDNGAAVSLAEVGATTGQWWPCTATANKTTTTTSATTGGEHKQIVLELEDLGADYLEELLWMSEQTSH